jgi:hypothetical protein
MKKLILVAIVISNLTYASANHSRYFDVFSLGASGVCDLDCGPAALGLKAKVLNEANKGCDSLSAYRVSNWKIHVVGYGRIHVSAAFVCSDATLAWQMGVR